MDRVSFLNLLVDARNHFADSISEIMLRHSKNCPARCLNTPMKQSVKFHTLLHGCELK